MESKSEDNTGDTTDDSQKEKRSCSPPQSSLQDTNIPIPSTSKAVSATVAAVQVTKTRTAKVQTTKDKAGKPPVEKVQASKAQVTQDKASKAPAGKASAVKALAVKASAVKAPAVKGQAVNQTQDLQAPAAKIRRPRGYDKDRYLASSMCIKYQLYIKRKMSQNEEIKGTHYDRIFGQGNARCSFV